MKKGPKLSIVYASTFALGLALLVALGPAGSEARAQSAGNAANGRDGYSSLSFVFEKERDGKDWRLTYSFKGLHEGRHSVTCRIPDAESRALERSFGFRDREWSSVEAAYFQEAILAAYQRLHYGTVRVTPGSRKAVWIQVLEPLNSAEELTAEAEERGFNRWYALNGQAIYDKAVEKYRNERGFVLHPQLDWVPDYSGLIGKSSKAMRDCANKLHEVTGGEPEQLMKFFQSMLFVPIELTEDGKYTGGLRLPPSLMISAQGDCDSKATAFCLIQRRRVVIFRSLKGKGDRKHALVGVEAYPSKSDSRGLTRGRRSTLPWETLAEGLYEEPILFGNVYYWPCEVSGGKEGSPQPSFKEVAIGHGGDYVPIPIPSPKK